MEHIVNVILVIVMFSFLAITEYKGNKRRGDPDNIMVGFDIGMGVASIVYIVLNALGMY